MSRESTTHFDEARKLIRSLEAFQKDKAPVPDTAAIKEIPDGLREHVRSYDLCMEIIAVLDIAREIAVRNRIGEARWAVENAAEYYITGGMDEKTFKKLAGKKPFDDLKVSNCVAYRAAYAAHDARPRHTPTHAPIDGEEVPF